MSHFKLGFLGALITLLYANSILAGGNPASAVYPQNACETIQSYELLCGAYSSPWYCFKAGGSADTDTIRGYQSVCAMGGTECEARHPEVDEETIHSYFLMCGHSDPESCLRRGGDADTIRTYQSYQDRCTYSIKECLDRVQC